MNIVILAAGKGKRMRSLHPKVLQPLAGRPMLDHVLATVQGFSVKPSIVVVGHGADEVEARYADELARHRRLLREWMEKHPAPRREKHLGLIPR